MIVAPRVSLREPVNFGVLPERAAEVHGRTPIWLNRPIDVDARGRDELDFVELALLVEELSAALHAAGVRRGDRLAVLKRPNWDNVVVAAAAARIGAIPALLSARVDAAAVPKLLERLDQPSLLTDAETLDRLDLDAGALAALVRRTIGDVAGGVPLDDLRGFAVPPPAPLGDEEPVAITHTSGTTGVPKLAISCARSITASSALEAARWPLIGHSPRRVGATALSYVHARALHGMTSLLSRGTPFLALAEPTLEEVARHFAERRPALVETDPNTYLAWEPLCDHPDRPFRAVQTYMNTFDAAHPRAIRRLLQASERRFPVYLQVYGQSETGGLTTRVYTRRTFRGGDEHVRARDVGVTVPFKTATKIVDPATGKRRRPGRAGVIHARSAATITGYFAEPGRFEAQCDGPWVDTGDVGFKTWRGTTVLLDRAVDQIAGVRSALELEDVLLDRLPEATEVVVVPDPEGQPVAVITTAGDRPVTDEAWRRATAGIAGLRGPKQLPESELPRTATLKVRRLLLREQLAARFSRREVEERVAARTPEVVR